MTSKYIALSEFERTSLLSFGVPPSKIAVIPNGVDTESMDTGPTESPSLGDVTSNFVFCASRFSRNKNLEFLAQVFDSIEDSVHLVIAGKLTDAAYFQQLRARINRRKIVLLPNTKDSEMRWLYKNCLFAVLPSLVETSPLTILEAMAARKPVVASNVGAISSLIVPWETGLLVSPSNREELARALTILLTNENLRLAMGEKARAFAESRSWKHVAALTLRVMKECLE
jgi:glycosyltransferase involved in cell wall biosynthesis